MARLQQQWEAHREPLNEQLSQLTLEVEEKKVRVADAVHQLLICIHSIPIVCFTIHIRQNYHYIFFTVC